MKYIQPVLAVLALTITVGSTDALAQRGGGGPQEPMTFFITSTAKGDGANFGGLTGADAHCQALAGRSRSWRCDLACVSQHAGPWRGERA